MAAILNFQVAGRVDFISMPTGITVSNFVLVSQIHNLYNSSTKLTLSAPLVLKPSFSQKFSIHSSQSSVSSLAQSHLLEFDYYYSMFGSFIGGGNVGECDRLSQLSRLLGAL